MSNYFLKSFFARNLSKLRLTSKNRSYSIPSQRTKAFVEIPTARSVWTLRFGKPGTKTVNELAQLLVSVRLSLADLTWKRTRVLLSLRSNRKEATGQGAKLHQAGLYSKLEHTTVGNA